VHRKKVKKKAKRDAATSLFCVIITMSIMDGAGAYMKKLSYNEVRSPHFAISITYIPYFVKII